MFHLMELEELLGDFFFHSITVAFGLLMVSAIASKEEESVIQVLGLWPELVMSCDLDGATAVVFMYLAMHLGIRCVYFSRVFLLHFA